MFEFPQDDEPCRWRDRTRGCHQTGVRESSWPFLRRVFFLFEKHWIPSEQNFQEAEWEIPVPRCVDRHTLNFDSVPDGGRPCAFYRPDQQLRATYRPDQASSSGAKVWCPWVAEWSLYRSVPTQGANQPWRREGTGNRNYGTALGNKRETQRHLYPQSLGIKDVRDCWGETDGKRGLLATTTYPTYPTYPISSITESGAGKPHLLTRLVPTNGLSC